MFLSDKEIDKNKFRKLYESLFEYMNVGDPNWKRLRYAISKLNTRAYDLSYGNLGFSDDGIIKIIDAGMWWLIFSFSFLYVTDLQRF